MPEDAVWFIQKKKITVSLGSKTHEARSRYLAVHTKWQEAIDRGIASLKGEPDDDQFMDRVTLFLNAEAAQAGGTLPEIDFTLNAAQRSNLFGKWRQFNLVKDGSDIGLLFDGSNDADLDRIMDSYKFYRAAMRGRVALSAQLPAPLAAAN